MSNHDYRALCAELLVALESWSPHGGGPLECWEDREEEADLIARARAALAQPEPQPPAAIVEMVNKLHQINNPAIQPVAPTDEEIEQWADAATEVPLEEMDPDIYGWRRCFTKEEFGASIRAALARWGTP